MYLMAINSHTPRYFNRGMATDLYGVRYWVATCYYTWPCLYVLRVALIYAWTMGLHVGEVAS